MNTPLIAVSSRSFSRHDYLRSELLKIYPNIRFNDQGAKLEGPELLNFLENAEKAIIGLERIDAELLSQLPKLKVISKVGVGLDKIDQAALALYGVALANTPEVNKRSVAELVLGLSLNSLRYLAQSNRDILEGRWTQYKGAQLAGCRIGIIGFGAIGKEVAKLFSTLDCECFYYDPYVSGDQANAKQSLSLIELLSSSDIVTLHIPLNDSTRYLLDAKKLDLMKPEAILINTARGGLVDEKALKARLQSKSIAAAAFDVFEQEPPRDNELLNLPNFFATAHMGGSTEEAIVAMGLKAIEGLENAEIPTLRGKDAV